MVVLQLVALLAPFFYLFLPRVTEAQYLQDYLPDTTNPGNYLYMPLPQVTPLRVINIEPYTVYLIYNCYYMREICKNAVLFSATARGQNLHPQSGLSNEVYGYDLDTGEAPTGQPKTHQESRRSASCPDNWKNSHPCPEADGSQRNPMRHDGEWFTTALEPGTTVNNLMNLRVNNQVVKYSNIRYTCDEFPPATWVEGGNGWGAGSPSNTRCAALACSNLNEPIVKAEQNWQGLSHGVLRLELQNAAQNQPGYNPSRSIILFRFRADNDGPDGIAARVYVIEDIGNEDQLVADRYTTQAKRQIRVNSTMTGLSLTMEELKARVKAGLGYETLVHENLTVSKPDLAGRSMPLLEIPGMPGMNRPYKWDLEDKIEQQEATKRSRINTTLPRSLLENLKPVPQRIPSHKVTPLIKRATAAELKSARSIVTKALAESQKLNKARVANPLRNKYSLRPGTKIAGGTAPGDGRIQSINKDVPPLLVITEEIAAAAALVAEAEMKSKLRNVTRRAAAAGSGTFWMQDIARKGTVPWGDDPDYVVFRNVLDYGAVGDGITDDTKAINKAMGTNSTRCGKGCNGSTTKNAIVYFPPGTYLVSSTLAMPFGTQVIGDANNRPTLVAAPSFVGLGVLSTDEYTGTGGTGIDGGDPEYYVNTANFYRQIRNIIIDIRQVTAGATITGIHYQVAQATSTQNVELISEAGTEQIGMFAENGSGGGISDITFTGGGIGLKGGNQQFTAQRLNFNGCDIGVQVIWDWGWVWKSITMKNVGTGFKLVGDDGVGNIGSVSILDSSFSSVNKAIVVNPITSTPGKGSTGVFLENVALSGVGVAVADTSGATLLASSDLIDQWVIGPVYEGKSSARSFSNGGKIGNYRRHSTLLDSQNNYFERAKPQYEDQAVSSFVHTKDLGCAGDGYTDDTVAFQAALYASLGKILFVDAGTYILTSTIAIPSGAKIVGETWSQLAASGSYFSNASNPKVFIQVGTDGEIGNVEMQDLLFTTRGPTAGAILVEWNLQAESQGAAGLWDCHARVGGATGTELTPAECPPATSGTDPGCSAASLMMHLTKSASGYFENMWLWGADHMIDDPDLNDANNTMVQTSIYIARGFLIESTNPTWLYGTASEHSVFYQYNFHSASNIYAGMLQTESPYYQPTPPPPAPFADVVGKFPGDPDYTCAAGDDFSGCDESWSTIITGSEDIFIAAAGIYSWFSTYSQTCIDTQQCQKAIMLLKDNFANIRITNLVTIGSKYMAVMDGKGITAEDNLNVDVHPDWSQISVLDVGSNGTTNFDEYIWIDSSIWEMDQPQFTCSPPCNVKIPPWTGATSTVDYPLITVSQGTWTSTITQPPLTITEWVFEVATLTQDSVAKRRRAAETLWPVPATTPFWPAVVYNGGIDGKQTTTSATEPFPKPPMSIGPDAPAPPSGSWPKRGIQPIYGSPEGPLGQECSFLSFEDPNCVTQPWFYGNFTSPGGDGGDIENLWDQKTRCPATTSSKTSTSSKPSPTRPAPSHYVQGDPRTNSVKCYNSGETTEDVRMQNAAKSFCGDISNDILGPGYFASKDFPFQYNGGLGIVDITISFQIKPRCSFDTISALSRKDLEGRDNPNFDMTLCEKYLSVPADSCNCAGVNGKQGGIVENNCYIWRIDPNLSF